MWRGRPGSPVAKAARPATGAIGLADRDGSVSCTTGLSGPLGWASFCKMKVGSAYNQSLLGAGTEDAQQLLLSLPVLVNRAITDYSGLVVDKFAMVSATGPVSIATSDQHYFSSDYRVEGDVAVGHAVLRPERIGKFSVVPAGS